MDLISNTRQSSFGSRRRQEGGYVLLTLLLIVALLVVAFATILPTVTFEMKRDQEQELIHRGVQYSRAIRAYYKKFGRYPTRLEDLENTNNLRFLRKRYKDPITHQDFKLLHFGEVKLSFTGGIGGGGIAGATPAGAPSGANGSSSAFGGSGFGGSGFGGSAFGGPSSGASGFGSSGANGTGVNSNGVFAQSSSFGGNSSGAFGASSNSQTGQAGTNPTSGSDSSSASQPVSQAPGTTTAPGDATSSSQQVIAGGPIVGVVSVSKKDGIREFNHKKKYSEWQFIYDPSSDRGGLLSTPNQPPLQNSLNQPGQNAQPGSNNGSAFGSSSSSGFGNSPNLINGPGTPAPP